MTNTNIESIRRAAVAGILGATATVVAGLVVQTVVQPATTVSDKMWSYPFTSSALVPMSIFGAVLHVFIFIAVLGFARSGLAGPSRGARVGLTLALTGTALLTAGELASIPARHQRVDDHGAMIAAAIFGIGALLSAVGFVAAGLATARAGLWQNWRRFTPLATGISTVAVLGFGLVGALDAGIALYGLCLLALSISLYTQPVPSSTMALQLRPQEQGA
jgi:hypothetical protein